MKKSDLQNDENPQPDLDTTEEAEPTIEENSVQSEIDQKSGVENNFRRVSFPQNDSELVTGYLEPANPWASVKAVATCDELVELYRQSCLKHTTEPKESVLEHLTTINLRTGDRAPLLSLKNEFLSAEACESLEEILKRVQYNTIDVSSCGLDDVSSSALFDMIEYYEATNELDVSENRNILNRGWQACISMVKKSQKLQIFSARANLLSDQNASNLGKAMMSSSLHTLKLEHCGLSGRPISSLCSALKRNTVLKELWLAHNDFTEHDAYSIGLLLKSNFYIQYLDISNNYIEDSGVAYIVDALIFQANKVNEFKTPSAIPRSENEENLMNSENTKTETDDDTFEKIDVDIGKSGGRSKLDVLLTNLVQNPIETTLPEVEELKDENDIKKLVQTQNTEILSTIYEHQAVNNNNNNNNSKETRLIGNNVLVAPEVKEKLDTVKEETLEQTENSLENEILIGDSNQIISDNILIADDTNLIASRMIENISKEIECTVPISKVDDKLVLLAENILLAQPDDNKDNDKTNLVNVSNDRNDNDDYLLAHPNQMSVEEEDEEIINVGETVEILHEEKDKSFECDNNNKNIITTDSDVENNEKENFIDETMNSDINKNVGIPTITETDNIVYETIKDDNLFKKPSETAGLDKSTDESTSHTNLDDSTNDILTQSFEEILIPDIVQKTQSPDVMITSTLSNEDKSVTNEFPRCDLTIINESDLYPQTNLPPPERSLSSDSLNSDTSIESNDSKSSIRLTESKFAKNGTLERQSEKNIPIQEPTNVQPTGIQVLICWNNQITRHSSKPFSDLLAKSNTLEFLNIGRNTLSNDFIANIKSNLKTNTTLTNLGLQGAHLSCQGIKHLAEILEFGGNSTIQRIDLRENNIETIGLTALDEALKSNKTITQIDLDDTPRKVEANGNANSDYTRLVTNIRAQCTRNENPPPETEVTPRPVKAIRSEYKSSRKISLTCQSIRPKDDKNNQNLLDPNNKLVATISPNGTLSSNNLKSIGRLKSPLPSPIPSPMSSPIPSPSRSRFQVSKVLENYSSVSPSSSIVSTSSSTNSSPSYSLNNSRFRVTTVNIKNDATQIINPKVTDKPASKTSFSNSQNNELINFNFNFDDNLSNLSNSNLLDDSCSSLTSLSSVESIDRQLTNTSSSNEDSSSIDIIMSPKMLSSTLFSDSLSLSDDKISVDRVDSGTSLNKMEENDDNTLTNFSQSVLNNPTNQDNLTLVSSPETKNPVKNNSNRVRKASFFTNSIKCGIMGIQNSGSGGINNSSSIENESIYPPGLEKLLSLFRSNPLPQQQQQPPQQLPPTTNPIVTTDSNNKTISSTSSENSLSNSSVNVPPTTTVTTARKESPMGGLFSWMTNPSNKKPCDEISIQTPKSNIAPLKTNSQILQKKLSDNQLLTEHISSNLNTSNSASTPTLIDNTAIPPEIHQEIKENISPENTITAENLLNFEQIERVHFEVGGDDDEEDDSSTVDDTVSSSFTPTNQTSLANDTTDELYHIDQNQLSLNSNLGSITRDSLAMLKYGGDSNDSQDSMRSLEYDQATFDHTPVITTSSTSGPYHQINIQSIQKND